MFHWQWFKNEISNFRVQKHRLGEDFKFFLYKIYSRDLLSYKTTDLSVLIKIIFIQKWNSQKHVEINFVKTWLSHETFLTFAACLLRTSGFTAKARSECILLWNDNTTTFLRT